MKIRILYTLLCFALLLSACSSPRSPGISGRPNPAYIQWLEQQTMLKDTRALTDIVSNTLLNWQMSAAAPKLPAEAYTWLKISPLHTAWAERNTFFSMLSKRALPQKIAALHFGGIFFSSVAETGASWNMQPLRPGQNSGDVSLRFHALAGTDREYENLLKTMTDSALLSGGTLLPAHTGMGADFSLALHHVRQYPSMYAMLEADPSVRHLLPPLPQTGSYAPLTAQQTELLIRQNALPPNPQPTKNGYHAEWAVSAPVSGIDGVKRQWLYRWYGSPAQPVLNWDDPSHTAQRVWEASLIRQVGLLHQSLVSVNTAAWNSSVQTSSSADASSALKMISNIPPNAPLNTKIFWLTKNDTKSSKISDFSDIDPLKNNISSLEPALSAVHRMAINSHRYGALMLLEDPLPAESLAAFYQTGADFLQDISVSHNLTSALQSGTAYPLQQALRRIISARIPHKAYWRSTDSAMKLAVRICHAEGTKIPNQELAARIENVHMLELAFQVCLPGLLMLSGSDLSGTIPQKKDQQEPAVWQIDHIPATRQGISAGTALYAEGEGSKGSKGTPCSLAKLLQIRQSTRIALGIITEIPNMNNPALLGVIAQLPEGAYLMFLGNMSSQNTAAQPTFPLWKQATAKQDMLSGSVCSSPAISLPPYGWKIFKLYAD